jgi:hypothetical protein
MYMTTKSLNHSRKNVVHECAGALVSPKGITKNLYEPYFVQQTVFSSSPFVIWIW